MLSQVDVHGRQSMRRSGDAGATFGIARLITKPAIAIAMSVTVMVPM